MSRDDNMSNIIKQLNNQKIACLGLGTENQALLSFLLKNQVNSPITICDRRSARELGDKYKSLSKHPQINWKLGLDYNKNLDCFDILFRSPGWPLFCPGIKKLKNKSTKISSPMNLFFALCPTTNIIGVSGTKGKGTTASLIAHILKKAKLKVFLGGNIGIAPFSFIDKIKKDDWVVLELSSFQLEDLKYSPKLAVITNIYKEHLAPADPLNPNYHLSYRDYILAKLKLSFYQKETDSFFFNKKSSPLLIKYKKYLGAGQIINFTSSKLPSHLIGEYNRENIAAAEMVAKKIGVNQKVIAAAVKSFIGLEHRLEFVTEKNNIKYYDNSFATNPESTAMDLTSFQEPIVLLAGGADKGANFLPLAKLIKQKVKQVVLFKGEATPRIKKALLQVGYPIKQINLATSMAMAIAQARQKAKPGDIILLSTACASFGLFKNYKERGNLFKEYAKK